MATSLNLAECTPKFGTEKHLEHPETLQYLNATLTHSVFGQLATARCLKILGRMRFKNTGDFLEIMDEESEELHGFNFSVGLFDQYSDIRPWLVDGGARSGSGCWGTELSVGDMMYIEEVRVKEGFRRRGVGSLLLEKILTSSHMGYKGHAFCWPTPIGSTSEDKAEWMRELAVITAFYRKNGFRRIGLTPFLAYSPSPSHPSRKLPISSDPETPSISFESSNPVAPNLKGRFECTCGVCTDGWLSPRMRFRLLAQAEIQEDMLRMDLSTFKPQHPLSTSNLFHPALEYIPPNLRRQTKSFYIGVSALLDAIAHVLKTPSGIPTPEAVITVAMNINPGAVQVYLGKGGKVEYVLDAVVDVAKGESGLGDGTFEDTFDYEEVDGQEDGEPARYKKLEKCANDLEFEDVRFGVGIGGSEGGGWGPYLDRENGEGMDVVEYDE